MGSGALRQRRERAVFLDRDGTLVRLRLHDGLLGPPASLAEFELLPGVGEAIDRLRCAGLRLVVVTNQPDVARGRTARQTVESINQLLIERLNVDAVLCCYHDDADRCSCRKPAPGMCFQAAEMFGLDLKRSFFVGDTWRDIGAGHGAGCTTLLLSVQSDRPRHVRADFVVSDLREAASIIVRCMEEETLATVYR